MSRFKLLPHWCFTATLPAFYDTESGTAIEQTARLHGVVESLINDYNKYVDEINKTINEFIESSDKDFECFTNKIIKICHDYIKMIDEKIKMQDSVIADAVNYMKTNLGTTLTEVIRSMRDSGELNEYVLSAFDDVVDRLTSLETFKTNTETKLTELDTFKTNSEIRLNDLETFNTNQETLNTNHDDRISSLESIHSYGVYDESNESLTFVFDEKEGEL